MIQRYLTWTTILAHRFGKAAQCFFPAPTRDTIGNNRDLLDAGFLDSLDLGSTLIDGPGDSEFIYQPIGNRFGVIRMLIHVVVIVVGPTDLLQNFLFFWIEHVGQ